MKIKKSVLALTLAGGLVGCSAIHPVPREQVATNLAPLLGVEKRFDQVKVYSQMIGTLGGISQEKAEELKGHYDIYYVYYLASNVYLAKGDMESYHAHIMLLDTELEAMERIIMDRLTQQGDPGATRQSAVAGSRL